MPICWTPASSSALGFAPFRGGPLQYAKDRGIDRGGRALEKLAGRARRSLPTTPGLAISLSD